MRSSNVPGYSSGAKDWLLAPLTIDTMLRSTGGTVMRSRSLITIGVVVLCAATGHAQGTAPVTPDSLVAGAKRAAGRDHAGTFLRICVAPDNLTPRQPPAVTGPRTVPDRATWYAKPYKVFDNLYFVGTLIHSAWALTTSEGIVVIDTLFDYAIEPRSSTA